MYYVRRINRTFIDKYNVSPSSRFLDTCSFLVSMKKYVYISLSLRIYSTVYLKLYEYTLYYSLMYFNETLMFIGPSGDEALSSK